MKMTSIKKLSVLFCLLCLAAGLLSSCFLTKSEKTTEAPKEPSEGVSSPQQSADGQPSESPICQHVLVTDPAIEPTCTETGKTEGNHCELCGEVLTAQEELAAKGHTPAEDPAVEPTCTEKGKTAGSHCSVCNEVLTAQQDVAAKGHAFKDATCEQPKTCTVCSATEGQALGHDYDDYVCTVCDALQISEGLEYRLDGNKYVIIGMGSCRDTELLLPLTHEGKSVSGVAEGAFRNQKDIRFVLIRDGITEIGANAFAGCESLREVSMPNSVKTIGAAAFENCAELKNITLPKSLKYIENALFSGCASLKKLTIPENVSEIGASAFKNCASLASLVLPEDLEAIEEYTFYGCENLTDINIPEEVTKIGAYAFSGCESLEEITIPDGVKIIERNAFMNCSEITKIVIPKSVTTIGWAAFNGCISLSEITLPFIGQTINETAGEKVTFGFIFGDISPNDDDIYCTNSYYGDYFRTSSGDNKTTQFAYYSYGVNSYHFAIPKSIRKVTITNQTIVPAYGFRNCDLIKEIIFEKPLSEIQTRAFENCTALKTLTYSATEDSLIQNYAFNGCTGFTSFDIPKGTLTIEDHAFMDCSELIAITIPDGVRTIGRNAFMNCSKVTAVVVPDSVITIGWAAFNGCTALVEITLPFIGQSANETDSIKNTFGFIFGDISPDDDSFHYTDPYGGIYYKTSSGENNQTTQYSTGSSWIKCYHFTIPKSIRKVTITNQSIVPAYAFRNCDLIKEITYTKIVTEVGTLAFENCIATVTHGGSGTIIEPSVMYSTEWLEWLTDNKESEEVQNKYNVMESGLYLGCQFHIIYESSAWEFYPYEEFYGGKLPILHESRFHLCLIVRGLDSVDFVGGEDYPYTWKTYYRLDGTDDSYKCVEGEPWSYVYGLDIYRYPLMDYGMEKPNVGDTYHMIFFIYDEAGALVGWCDQLVEWNEGSEKFYEFAEISNIIRK